MSSKHLLAILAASVLAPGEILIAQQTPPPQGAAQGTAQNTARGAGQAIPQGQSPQDLAKTRAEFLRVQARMEDVQREFDRAARGNLPAVRDTALKDWQRSLDGLAPYVKELSPAVPDEKALIDQFNTWRDRYQQAADPALAGQFFLQISQYWTQLNVGTDGWEKENAAPSFAAFEQAPPNDPLVQSLGMPKTLAFVTVANTYLQNVAARPDYERFKGFENVQNDQEQVQAARDAAYAKLAKAADGIIGQAAMTQLDQNGHDRLDAFVEQRLPVALAGYDGLEGLELRGRQAVYAYDKTTLGEQAAQHTLDGKLTAAAERDWPKVAAIYALEPAAPVGAGRGQIVRINATKNLIGKEFGTNDYDFAGYINGAPVVGRYVPAVKIRIDQTLALTGMKSLPDVDYDIVGIIRGTAQVPNVKQRPGATTAPAAADDATATTSPAVTDCTVLDIVAVHAGPLAVGTKVEVTASK